MLKERAAAGLSGLVVLVFVFSAGLPLGSQADPRCDTAATKNLMVPMRDGVKLATDTHRPARNGQPVEDRFPREGARIDLVLTDVVMPNMSGRGRGLPVPCADSRVARGSIGLAADEAERELGHVRVGSCSAASPAGQVDQQRRGRTRHV